MNTSSRIEENIREDLFREILEAFGSEFLENLEEMYGSDGYCHTK